MKKLLFVLILTCLAGLGLYFYPLEVETDEPKIEYKTAEVKQGELLVKTSAKGVVEPYSQVELKSKASGEVLEFPYNEGDPVKKGQLLIRLDKSDETRSVLLAEADLTSANASLKKAESALILEKIRYKTDLQKSQSEVIEAEANLKDSSDKLRRQKDLFNQKIVSQEALDAAQREFKVNQENLNQAKTQQVATEKAIHDIAIKENEVEQARAEVQRKSIALEEKRERLTETEIFAPMDGVLIQKLIEEGQIIASGISNVGGGTALAQLADLSRMFIITDVDETDIGKIKEGQKVRITTDAFENKLMHGKVLRIAPQGEVESSITIFKVKVEILGKGKTLLKPKMSANVDIILKRARKAVYVPREAISNMDGKEFVAVLNPQGDPEDIEVKTGIKNLIDIQIKKGLKPGQKIVLGDWKKIKEEALASKNKSSTLSKILWIIRSR